MTPATVLITGASQGIGAALARQLAAQGHPLALVARDEARLRQLNLPGAVILPADLAQPGSAATVFAQATAALGPIQILINNAGRGLYVPAFKANLQDARDLFELNFFAPLQLCQLAAESMAARGGTIVNISSVLGLFSAPWSTLYASSKFALTGLSDGLRIELASRNVHLLTVYPGYVATDFQSNVIAGAPPAKLQAMRRLSTTPDRCAAAIIKAIHRRQSHLVVPGIYRLIALASSIAPALVDAWLRNAYSEMEAELL